MHERDFVVNLSHPHPISRNVNVSVLTVLLFQKLHSLSSDDKGDGEISGAHINTSFESMSSTFAFSDALASISLHLRHSRDTSSPFPYRPYSIYQQTMFPTILRDPNAAKKLFETIIDSLNGHRSMSCLARRARYSPTLL